ncbi:MAG: aspartate/glutamate racemase family protein [Spirochaetia bacterium]|nr:aspartate/glutamate racemase family protein [Spirochaetia bacterium]MCF7946819.1 aspartate/glutamate racemase family protein [Spirochaetia bacterium]MCF7953613.1 aspartate/glutamate racemase family protein [Spirochaetales bacterium]
MKQVAIIHTVKPVLNSFELNLKDFLSFPIQTHNILDDFLASDPAETGFFSVQNKQRLYNDIRSAELTGADVIVVTCSTLSPTVNQIRPFIKCPVIAIDDAMTKKAVRLGERIFVLATAASTLKPTIDKVLDEAKQANKKVEIESAELKEAYSAMKEGNLEKHDQIVIERAKKISETDVIILAQASMAHLEEKIQTNSSSHVLSSIKLCMQEINEVLER